MNMSFASLLTGLLLSVPAWAAVNLNHATASELEAVTGIGPVKAKSIVEYRHQHGPFKNLEELTRVRGFGKANVAKLKYELSVTTSGIAGIPPALHQKH